MWDSKAALLINSVLREAVESLILGMWSCWRALTPKIEALQSIIIYQTRPSISPLVLCTQPSDLGLWGGKRTGREKVMMFVMSLSVDLSLAAGSLDSHSQAITLSVLSRELTEGLGGNEEALISEWGDHHASRCCVHSAHTQPLNYIFSLLMPMITVFETQIIKHLFCEHSFHHWDFNPCNISLVRHVNASLEAGRIWWIF